MKHFITFLLFPFLAAAQPIISCTDVIKPYADFDKISYVTLVGDGK